MNWTEISIKISSKDIDIASSIANECVPYGIYIEDYSDLIEQSWEIAHVDLIEQDLLDKNRNEAVVHLYISEEDNAYEAINFISEQLKFANVDFEILEDNVDDTNWLDGWKKYFKPIEIGDKLVVCPSWEEYNNDNNKTIISIDPGAAFGTGTHATTSLCLGILEKHVNSESTVLDIGCGSGILGISSVLLGAKYSDGVDIDSQAVKTANENAEINSVADKTNFFVGDLLDKIKSKYNVICANIVADVIIELLENVHLFLEEDGILITSGIIDSRENDVLDAFNKFGYKILESYKKDNWRAFVCRKEKSFA